MNQVPKQSNGSIFANQTEIMAVFLFSGIGFAVFSLGLIAFKLVPISESAQRWNSCVDTTSSFLMELSSFRSTGKDGLEAMSVSLCNGSTPQRTEPNVSN